MYFSTEVWGFPWLHRARYRMGQFPKALVYSFLKILFAGSLLFPCRKHTTLGGRLNPIRELFMYAFSKSNSFLCNSFCFNFIFSLFCVTFYVILLGWLSRIQRITIKEKFNYCIFATGQTSRSVARSRSSKATFIKYHIYAWISPAIIVIISFALDTSGAAFIGYGKLLID